MKKDKNNATDTALETTVTGVETTDTPLETTDTALETTDTGVETVSPDGLVTMSYKGFTKDGETEVVLNSTKLIEHTNIINAYLKLGRSAQLGIAYELATVYKDESFKSSFKNIDDYAATMFNIKHTTTTLYRMVGELFITKTDNNIPLVKDGLPQFSVGQLIELLPLYKGVKEKDGKARLITLLNEGAFGQYSTTKAIREAVKNSLLIETSASVTPNTTGATDNDNASKNKNTSDNTLTFEETISEIDKLLTSINDHMSKNPDTYKPENLSKLLTVLNSFDDFKQSLR